jgi:hypothetical protein
MAEVARSTAQLSAENWIAIAKYVKSLPPIDGMKPQKRNDPDHRDAVSLPSIWSIGSQRPASSKSYDAFQRR